MAVVAPPHPAEHGGFAITQTHADVTRDVVATLEQAVARLRAARCCRRVTVFLIGLLTFLILVKDGLGTPAISRRSSGASTSPRSCSGSASGTPAR